MSRLFIATVVAPTILATFYYGVIASDVYTSESSFVIRSPQKETQSGFLGSIFQGGVFSRSPDDAFTVNEYLLSRDAVADLNRYHYLEKAFSRDGVDLFNRFPGLDFDGSFEALHRYFQKQVQINFDSSSSIITLQVNAFTAADAQRINRQLLEHSEALINRMNDRARQDLIRNANDEVELAEGRVKEAAIALANYRNKQAVFDTDLQSGLQLQQVAALQASLVAAKAQLVQLQSVAPDNPQIPVLKLRIVSLQGEMDKASGAVVGGKGSLAQKATAYQRLQLNKEFAEKQLASALTSLESARSSAQRQHLYLERIAQPSLPDNAMGPKRIRGILTVIILGLVTWGASSLLLASVREHKE